MTKGAMSILDFFEPLEKKSLSITYDTDILQKRLTQKTEPLLLTFNSKHHQLQFLPLNKYRTRFNFRSPSLTTSNFWNRILLISLQPGAVDNWKLINNNGKKQ